MPLVFRLMLMLSVCASLSGCHKSRPAVAFYGFTGHYLLISGGRIAIDSDTGRPMNFVFVNNTSSQLPDGTFQHPYPTLTLAAANSVPYDVIYVFPGDGTTGGMDSGIVLQANQRFWGAGASHVAQTSAGGVTIPAITASSPTITNTGGSGITLATDNDISGFRVSDATDNGIYGVNPKSIHVSACTIDNSQLDQIHLEYGASSGSIALDSVTLTNGQQRAIFIDSTIASPPVDFVVNNTVIQGTSAQFMDASFTNEVNARLTNNTIEGNGSSGSINFSGAATLLVSSNTFNNNTSISDPPLVVVAGSGALSAVVNSNTISGNTAGAIRFVLNNTTATLSMTGNTISNNGTGSLGTLLGSAILISPNGTSSGNCNLVLNDNTISGNASNAFVGTNGDFNNFEVAASRNSITGNGGGGFVFDNPANTLTLTATNNTISGGGDNGILTTNVAITTAHITLSNNQITGNTNSANGVSITHTGASLNFTATNNTISGNDGSGILMYSGASSGNVVASIENNTIGNNQNTGSNASAGIDLEQFTNLSLRLDGNALSNNDVYIGSTESSPSVCMEMSSNNSNAAYTLSNGSGTFNLAPMNVASVNVGTINTIGTITLIPSCP